MPNRRPRPHLAARLLAPALALLALLLLPAAASADGWVRGPVLTFADDPDIGQLGTFSEIAADAAGVTSIAWLSVDRAGMEASARLTRIAPDGTTGPALELGRTLDPPSLAVAPTGATAVAWPDADEALQLATFAPGGAHRDTRIVASGPASNIDVGIGDGGDAVVIWTGEDGALHVRRVAASGVLGPHESVPGAGGEQTLVAVARDGSAWVLWFDGGGPWTARISPEGALGTPVQLSDSGTGFGDLVAGADGAVALWTEPLGSDERALISRLAPSGDVAGPAIEVAPAVAERSLPEAALLPGGAVDVVYQPPTPGGGGGMMFTPSHAILRRVEPSGALGAERPLTATATTLGSGAPRISAGSDGSATVTWIDVSSDDLALVGVQQRPDGTTTAPRTITRGLLMFLGLLPTGGEIAQVTTSRLGVATVAWPQFTERTSDVATARYDGIAPVVEAIVPANVSYGSDAQFAVNVSDDSGVASVWWEFGDDSGSRRVSTRHRYASPGVYPVSVTVIDNAGNETTVTRQVSVLSPPPRPGRVSAALKLGKVSRRGAKVTVAGTLDRRASGTVTVAYAQRIGRRSQSKRVSARIANGRFSATVRLTGALAKARGGKATVTVSYAGNADTNTASAKKTVTVPKAKAKKPKRSPKRR